MLRDRRYEEERTDGRKSERSPAVRVEREWVNTDAMEKDWVITYKEGVGEEWDNESRTKTWEDDRLTEEVVRETQMNRKCGPELSGELSKLSLDNGLQEGQVDLNTKALGQDQYQNSPIIGEAPHESSSDPSVPPGFENPALKEKEIEAESSKRKNSKRRGSGTNRVLQGGRLSKRVETRRKESKKKDKNKRRKGRKTKCTVVEW
ncbi:hypothetical protein PIB30_063971 [Stylosanthes scabra]|uniref:Uncharacterized protein n=1 Tax=Stylosanthes scabra TaxID=79078 RepID=A0ABU6QMF5_9FABA|nr:hypothetical protein [Stylosanthes scabra]